VEAPTGARGKLPDLQERLRSRERDGLDEAVRRFSFVAGDVRPALADRLGLSSTELRAIEHVMDEPMGPVELARRLGVTSAAGTTLVRRLESRGHLERSPHPDDGRRVLLSATPNASAAVAEVLVPLFDEMETARTGMSEQDLAVVTSFLDSVSEIIEGHLEGPWRRRR
jgi:DNA-binding MarR family transcriptional regulator